MTPSFGKFPHDIALLKSHVGNAFRQRANVDDVDRSESGNVGDEAVDPRPNIDVSLGTTLVNPLGNQ